MRTISFIGVTVPRTFDMCVMATIFVRGEKKLLEFVDEEIALVVDWCPFDHGALALAQEVPGHDVGVVLHDREDDLVPLPDRHAAEGIRDEVDRPRWRIS